MDNISPPPRSYPCGCTSPASKCPGCRQTPLPHGATVCGCISHASPPGKLGGAPRQGAPGPIGETVRGGGAFSALRALGWFDPRGGEIIECAIVAPDAGFLLTGCFGEGGKE